MKPFYFLTLMLIPWIALSQSKPTYFDKNIGFNYVTIDTSNSEIRAIAQLWKNYLIRRVYVYAYKIDTAGYCYWNEEEKQLYNDPDLILSDPLYYWTQTNVLNIKPIGQGFFQIMNVKGWVDDSTQRFRTTAIFYVLAKKVNDKFKLFNYFYLDKEKLLQTKIRNVCYYYPADHKFDKQNAIKFVNFEDSLSSLFNSQKPKELIYLIDRNQDSLFNHLGFVYCGLMGMGKHGGKFIYKENMLLSSVNENHRHELVHYFTKMKNPDVIGFFDEGLATYFGGNLGNTLQWHLNYLNEYIKDKPALDLADENKLIYIDAKTNPQYVLGAIIMKYTIEKFGFQKALALLQYSRGKNNYSEVIEKELGIKKSELNTFFRNYLKEHADK